jgi:hypothetical protein
MSVGTQIWLDDRRPPPSRDWDWVRTPEEAIDLLRTGEVERLSLDHDLGLDVGGRERTGYDVLAWLEQEVGTGRATFPLPALEVHSANPPAAARMERAIGAIQRLAER